MDIKKSKYHKALKIYQPYLAVRNNIKSLLDTNPIGIKIREEHIFDPLHTRSADFMTLVHRLNTLICGPFGMEMPKWAEYDCSLVPGICCGFGKSADKLSPALRNGLKIPEDYHGLVPFSVLLATPFSDRKSWFIYSIGSINQEAPGAGPFGLRRLTLALATSATGSEKIVGSCSWRSSLINVFAALGPLKLMTAWTPCHDDPTTTTFQATTDDKARNRLLMPNPEPEEKFEHYLDADDHKAMGELQGAIENGSSLYIGGPGKDMGTELQIPIIFKSLAID